MSPRLPRLPLLLTLALAAASPSACQRMRDQPRIATLGSSPVFPDEQAARPPVPGTVARGQLALDTALDPALPPPGTPAGPTSPRPTSVRPELSPAPGPRYPSPPAPPDAASLTRGRQRFEAFCSPCHGFAGAGDGAVVARGFPAPPTFHQPRLRQVPDGYLFDVITRGYGQMYSYAARVTPPDRWAIVAYIRALQLSQHARVADLPPALRARLEAP